MGISPLLVFGCGISICGWIVACAGIASMQAFDLTATNVVTGATITISPSSWRLSFEWFVWSFQFTVLVLIAVLAVMKKLRQYHSAANANLAFLSVLWAIFANEYYKIVRGVDTTQAAADLSNAGYYPNARLNTLIAGACIIIVGNFFAMFGTYGEDDIVAVSDKPVVKPVPTNEVPVAPTQV